MKKLSHLVAVVATAASSLLFSAPSYAQWELEWQRLFGSNGAEPSATLISVDADTVRVAGSTTGDFADPSGQVEYDLFWADVTAESVRRIEQEPVPGKQLLRGYVRSGRAPHFLNESRLVIEGKPGSNGFRESRFTTSIHGRVLAEHHFSGNRVPMVGLAKGTFGRHWTASAERRFPAATWTLYSLSPEAKPTAIEVPAPDGNGHPWLIRSDGRRHLRVALAGADDAGIRHGIRVVDLDIGTGAVRWSAFFPRKGNTSFVPRDLLIDRRGWSYVTMVDYDRKDWHTRIAVIDADGKIVSDFRIDKLRYFCGWRLALDNKGRLYVAGSEYGEPAYPVLVECVPDAKGIGWRQSEPYYLNRNAATFVRGLHTDPEGDSLTVIGCVSRWDKQKIHGGSDVFVVRLRREEIGEGNDGDDDIVLPVRPIEPKRSVDPIDQPW